ncbi:hypothetical protein [Arenimonas sp. MALMAid1274]|uniref:hypothetical protein n=1 Tax=Arenimonas sp. MALMAid1274 TaxID=3411630 RepID=UPI003B9E47BF
MAKPAKSRWKKAMSFLFGFVGFGVAGYWVGRLGAGMGPVRDRLDALSGWDLLALPLLWLLVIAMHEAGHLAGGLGRGMRFLIYIAGPLGLVRTAEGIRFRWYFNLGTLGGLAAAIPRTDRPLRGQLVPMIAGGPLASLVLAIAGALLFVADDGRAGAYGVMVAALSAMIFVVTALPMRAGGFMSDGMQLREAFRDPGMIERRTQLMALAGQGIAGTRPRELDATILARAQALTGQETMYDIGVWAYSYNVAMDHGDTVAAGQWLDRIEPVFDQYPDGFRQSLALELAYYEARHRARLPEAEAWLQKARGGVVDASRRALAEAAVAALRQQPELARAALDRAQAQLGRGMDGGARHLSQDQIHALRRELSPSLAPAA